MAHIAIPGQPMNTVGFQFAFTQPRTSIASGLPSPGAVRGYDPSTYRSMKDIDTIRQQTPPLPENKYLPLDTPKYNVINANFAAAQVEFPIFVRNNFLFFNWWSAVGAVVPSILIRIDDQRNDQIIFTPGMRLRGFNAQNIWVSWGLVAGETGQLIYAYKENDVESLF